MGVLLPSPIFMGVDPNRQTNNYSNINWTHGILLHVDKFDPIYGWTILRFDNYPHVFLIKFDINASL